jgi:hypothetical protein
MTSLSWGNVETRNDFTFFDHFVIRDKFPVLFGRRPAAQHYGKQNAESKRHSIAGNQAGQGRSSVLCVKLVFLFFGLQEAFFLFFSHLIRLLIVLIRHFLVLR